MCPQLFITPGETPLLVNIDDVVTIIKHVDINELAFRRMLHLLTPRRAFTSCDLHPPAPVPYRSKSLSPVARSNHRPPARNGIDLFHTFEDTVTPPHGS